MGRVGAMKMTCDGSISERTARLSQPYVGRPGDFGIWSRTRTNSTLAPQGTRGRLQIGVHANGDVAIDIMLRLFERLQRERPRPIPLPHRALHRCERGPDPPHQGGRGDSEPVLDLRLLPRREDALLRPERLDRMFAVRSFLDAGIRVTQASDYPPGPFEPMMALQSSVTRTDSKGNVWGPKQRVSVEEALRVGTLHGAYASYEERLKGSIEPGKLADLVVLGRDPTREDPSRLIQIPVERNDGRRSLRCSKREGRSGARAVRWTWRLLRRPLAISPTGGRVERRGTYQASEKSPGDQFGHWGPAHNNKIAEVPTDRIPPSRVLVEMAKQLTSRNDITSKMSDLQRMRTKF